MGSHVSPLQHACVEQSEPTSEHPAGGVTTVSTHCAMWLCAVKSWNGSQNAGKLPS